MITFKQFLNEKAMRPSEFKQVEKRQSKNAKVGFEFECIIPEGTRLHPGELEEDLLTTKVKDIKSFEAFKDIFTLTPRRPTTIIIEKEFNNWAEQSGLDKQLDDDFFEFVKKQYGGSLYALIKKHDLYPYYGWVKETENDNATFYTEEQYGNDSAGEDALQLIAFANVEKSLSKALGKSVVIPHTDRGKHMEAGQWIVTPDESIKGKRNDIGVEVISPPTDLGDALADLNSMFKWMSDNGIETNITTGLHINLSVPNIANIDPVKLVLFSGESHVLKQFDRLANSYTKSQIDNIINKVSSTGELPKEANQMIELARKNLSTSKYNSIHTEKLKHGYLEFRMAGNKDYHKDFNKIKNTVLRFVSGIEMAIDPKAERNEYLKKLSKLFSTIDTMDVIPENQKLTIIDLLEGSEFGHNIVKELEDLTSAVKSGKFDKVDLKMWVTHKLLNTIFVELVARGIKDPSDRQKAELKIILKRLGITLDDLQDGNSTVRQMIKMFGLK